jgi:hypothetical protein
LSWRETKSFAQELKMSIHQYAREKKQQQTMLIKLGNSQTLNHNFFVKPHGEESVNELKSPIM